MKYTTTSTEHSLGKGPMDMPDRGKGGMPNKHSDSTTVKLSRTANHVANLANKPRMGTAHYDGSTMATLSRGASMPYGDMNATKPQVPFKGKRK